MGVKADIMRHFTIDKNRSSPAGSLRGYSTWKQSTMFPDLYAAAIPARTCPSWHGLQRQQRTRRCGFVCLSDDRLAALIPLIGSVGGADGPHRRSTVCSKNLRFGEARFTRLSLNGGPLRQDIFLASPPVTDSLCRAVNPFADFPDAVFGGSAPD
jgi:hypothetical protein